MTSQFRRKRGTPTVGVQFYIAPDVKELLDKYTAATGLPQWAIVEAAIRAGQPDETGVPVGWDLPSVTDQPHLDLNGPAGGEPVRRTG